MFHSVRSRQLLSLSLSLTIVGLSLGTCPSLAQTGFNPGATSPAAGSTAGASGGFDPQQFTGFVQSYLKQLDALKDQVSQIVQKITSSGSSAVSKAIQDALGDLNLPDPQKLLDNLAKSLGIDQDGKSQSAQTNSVSGVSPVIYTENQAATLPAKVFSQANFSSDAQKSVKQDLQNIQQKVSALPQMVNGSTQLSNQSSQAATTANQGASAAQQQAKQAQSRVSTQDAIKDLNLTAGSIATQLGALSSQSAAQSGQLANLTSLGATSAEFQGDASAKLSQVNLGVAAAVGQLAELNEQSRGNEQLRVIQEQTLADQLNASSRHGFNLLR